MKPRFKLPFDVSLERGFSTPLRLLLATTAAFWMGAAQPQPTVGAGLRPRSELRLREFFDLTAEYDGLVAGDMLRRMDGQLLHLQAYMVRRREPVPGSFLIAARPGQVLERDDDLPGLSHRTIVVNLDVGQRDRVVPYVSSLVVVSGLLELGQPDAPAGSTPFARLQLGPDAIAGRNAFELAGYLHRPERRRTGASGGQTSVET